MTARRRAPSIAASRDALRAHFPFIAKLAPSAAAQLQAAGRMARFDPKQVLLTEGVTCDAVLFVLRGAIRVFRTAPSGRPIGLYRIEPGESCVLGISCVLAESGYGAQAETAEPTEAFALGAQAFRLLFRTEPAMQQFVMGLFARRLAAVMALVEEVAFRRVDERLARLLLRDAAASGKPRIVARSHEELAAQLGTAREVVSRILAQFEEDGLVRLERRRIRVLDGAALAARGQSAP